MKKSVILLLLFCLVGTKVFTVPPIIRLCPHEGTSVLQTAIVDRLLFSRTSNSMRAFCLNREATCTHFEITDPTHMSWLPGSKLLWAGTKNGSIQSFYKDVSSPQHTVPLFDVSVNAMALPEEGDSPYVYAAGGGTVKVVDKRMMKGVEEEAVDLGGDIEQLMLASSSIILASSHNRISVLNLKKGATVVAEHAFPSSVNALPMSTDKGHLFYAATRGGNLYQVNTLGSTIEKVVVAGESLQKGGMGIAGSHYAHTFLLPTKKFLTAQSQGPKLLLRSFEVVEDYSSIKRVFLGHDTASMSVDVCGESLVAIAGGPNGEVSLVPLDGFKKDKSSRSKGLLGKNKKSSRVGLPPRTVLETIPEEEEDGVGW